MTNIEFLSQKVPLFIDFSTAQLEELIQDSEIISFEINEAVIEFGEKGRFLGILSEGEAEVSVTSDRGEKHRIGILKSGDVFGEMSLMTGNNAIADVVGITRCKAILIPRELFSAKLIAHAQAIQYLSRLITERLKQYTFDIQGKELAARALQQDKDPYGFELKSLKPMQLLIFNASTSTLRYKYFNTANPAADTWGNLEGLGSAQVTHTYTVAGKTMAGTVPAGGTHAEAAALVINTILTRSKDGITAVGHRVVHGGDKFNGSVIITDQVLEELAPLSGLAPLHNPVNLAVIREARRLLPLPVTHIAVFDTAFHQTLPPYAYTYGLPAEYCTRYHFRRYGFHGMSHRFAALKAAQLIRRPYNALEIVTCHLGSGSSLCAIDHGRSVDTSMGFSPADGLIMATRSGSLDPGLVSYLMREAKLEPDAFAELINKQSGLLGISGSSGDIMTLDKKAAENDDRALLAIKTYAYQIRKEIGAYMAAMGGLDVLVFTGTIGAQSSLVRSLACHGLDCLGIQLDRNLNQSLEPGETAREISASGSQVKVIVVVNEEERMMAREVLKVLEQEQVAQIINTQADHFIPLEVSAHHIHLSREHVEALFGPGYQLTVKAPLSQPGQFACNETVTLSGSKGTIERVRVLGPERKESQVEIAMTEQFKLGVQPPIRESGDLQGTPGVTLIGDKGQVTLPRGVICAMRHIHMAPEDALSYGLRDKDMVRVRVEGDRELIFGDVLIRVRPDFKLAMHIDTDEANAANIRTGMKGYIDSIQSRG